MKNRRKGHDPFQGMLYWTNKAARHDGLDN
jgi:hypothetical protein